MTKLEKLLQELCPEGVVYKTLREIATDVFRGAGITRDQVRETGTPCVRYGEIYTTYGVWFENCVSHTDETLLTSKKYFGYGDILFAITGESVEDIAKCCAYIGHETCLAGGDIVVLKHNEDPKYLSYALSTLDAQKQKSKGKVKSKVVHSSVPDIKAIRIPVPPLPVQREIVRILDNFTELTEGLNRELAAELTARKKQYAYYRDKLLHNDATTVYKRLGDFCDLLSGFPFDSSKFKEDGIRLMRGMNIKRGYLDFTEENNRYWESTDGVEKYLLNDQDIVISMDGSLVGSSYGMVSKKDLPLLLVQRVTRIRTNQANIRYVYHYIASGRFTEYVHKKKTAGAIPHISLKDISNFEVPLPSLEIQKRLVEVLDNFDALCTDLNIGLPAEIEARKKQYEFYRDQLLTFAAQGETILTDRQTSIVP